MKGLVEPHGGALVELLAPEAEREQLRRKAVSLASWELTGRQLCDLELLMNGAFSPLTGFMGRADYERVVREMRLVSGLLWPIPVTLDVSEELARSLESGSNLVLRDPEGVPLAVLEVTDQFEKLNQA